MSKIYEIIVRRDEDVKTKIEAFLIENGWKSAYISGAIGSVKEVYLTAPETMEIPLKVGTTRCVGPGEMLTFTGEVMTMDRIDPDLKAVYKDTSSPYFIHIHASLAVAGGHVYGGGFQKGTAFRSLKIYIQQQD